VLVRALDLWMGADIGMPCAAGGPDGPPPPTMGASMTDIAVVGVALEGGTCDCEGTTIGGGEEVVGTARAG
jgi:hypothetical protein